MQELPIHEVTKERGLFIKPTAPFAQQQPTSSLFGNLTPQRAESETGMTCHED